VTVTSLEQAPPSGVITTRQKLRRSPLVRFVAGRVFAGVVTLFALSLLVFLACSVIPGDAASQVLGKHASGEALEHMRALMGLDRPVWERYGAWMTGFLHGDLGNTVGGYSSGTEISVWSQVKGPLNNSLVLGLVAFVPIVGVSLLFGTLSAVRSGKWVDQLISVLTLVPAALPEFVVGALLIALCASWLDVLPAVSLIPPGQNPLLTPELLVLPVLTLIAVTVGPASRMIRAGMVEALRSDWVLAARLNGVAERRVLTGYALRNALAPSIQVFALIAQYLIGGLIVVEYLYGYPGIGKELVEALAIRDSIEVQSVTMLLAIVVIATTVLADLLVMLVVPKLRTEAA